MMMTAQERKHRLGRVGCKNHLGKASKMPCATYSLPAAACKLGQVLAKLKNSTCSGYYADGKGNYSWPNVIRAMERRLASIGSATWVEDMTELIRAEKNPYFRWHDSGDIQSVGHLVNINQIALNLPEVKFWLPTREAGMVSQFMRQYGESKAANLIIRLSAAMVNGKAPDVYGLPVSYVHTGVAARFKGVRVCPAPNKKESVGSVEIAGIPHYPSPITNTEVLTMKNCYVVYINGDPFGKSVFPYTVDGFVQALEAAGSIKKPFRLDVVRVINPNRVDIDDASGLTEDEQEVAVELGFGEYI